MAANLHAQRPGHGYDNPVRYLFRSSGGIIAYLISIGMPLSILAFAALGRRGATLGAQSAHAQPCQLIRQFVFATILAVFMSAFSGMCFLETERIWVFFTPAMAIAAAYELNQREQSEGRHVISGVLLAMLTFACCYELTFQHHLWALNHERARTTSE